MTPYMVRFRCSDESQEHADDWVDDGLAGTLSGTPPQGSDAKCGFACHTTAKAGDYVFTEYGKR